VAPPPASGEVIRKKRLNITKKENTMVRFYDPKDAADLARVEAVLHKGGIEYSLAESPKTGISVEIEVAEEDVPKAEELLLKSQQGSSKK
jgi:hypothetical protein